MEMQKYKFSCPQCNGVLNDEKEVKFIIRTICGKEANIFLSPQIGEYDYHVVPKLEFEKHELVNFFCHCCHANLVSKKHSDYVEIHMNITEEIKFDVLFSRKAGVKRTYVITEDDIDMYGEQLIEAIDGSSQTLSQPYGNVG